MSRSELQRAKPLTEEPKSDNLDPGYKWCMKFSSSSTNVFLWKKINNKKIMPPTWPVAGMCLADASSPHGHTQSSGGSGTQGTKK